MDKKKVQEAIARIDQALAQLNINRQAHIILTNDIRLIQTCCMEYFDDELVIKDLENERAIEHVDDVEVSDENCKRSGDGV